jgi:DNA-binding CsgD family transcriptional regulator
MKEISLRLDRPPVPRTPRRRGLSGELRQLTAREREILGLLAVGMGTAAIAGHLAISTATVRNHVQRIIAKLRVHSRLAAVARGYATGLITAPGWGTAPKPDGSGA